MEGLELCVWHRISIELLVSFVLCFPPLISVNILVIKMAINIVVPIVGCDRKY